MKKRAGDMTPLCENFCIYYKPGKKVGLACEGFKVVRRLLEEGKTVSFAKRRNASAHSPTMDKLRATMCTNCTFSEADCDFLLTNGEALPCGGFVLLHHLLNDGEITLQEIKGG